jgi:hypothetical protein
VLEEVIDQAPADYFTVGWLTSTLQQRSFGIVMVRSRATFFIGVVDRRKLPV